MQAMKSCGAYKFDCSFGSPHAQREDWLSDLESAPPRLDACPKGLGFSGRPGERALFEHLLELRHVRMKDPFGFVTIMVTV